MRSLVRFWLENARWVALPQSLTPALAAAAMASTHAEFSILLAIVSSLGVCMAHLSLNLFDDYFDYKKNKPGIRDTLARAGFRARTGKCDYLISGEATVKQLLAAALIFGGIAGLCGIVVFIFRGLTVIWFVLVVGALGLAYSAEPLRLSYRGLGEPTIGLIFGPLLVSGVYFSSSGIFGINSVVVGAAIGLLVTNILYCHSVLDLEADKSVGKLTLAGIIPSPKGRVALSFVLLFLPYAIIFAGVIFKLLPLWYLLTMLTLPMAVALARSMLCFYRNPQAAVSRRVWYGIMTKWEEIKAEGIDWFMLRWYLARNIIMSFSVLIIIAAFLS